MKKFTAIVLTLLMLLGLFPLTAYAANGPDKSPMAFAVFYGGMQRYPVYEGSQVVETPIAGASYDLSTNTVTITNFNHPELGFSANMMGDDLKLKIVGNCVLANIIVYGWGYGGSLSIIGDGTLTIDARGTDRSPITLPAEDTDAVLTFGKDVKLHIYGESDIAQIIYTKHADKATAIVAENGEVLNVTGGQSSSEESEILQVVSDNDDEGWTYNYGLRVTKASDPEGIYGAKYSKEVAKYMIRRFFYVEQYDKLTEDNDFDSEYLTEAEMTAKGYSFIYSDQPVKIQCFTEEEYKHRGTHGDRVVRKSDPEGMYCVYYSWDGDIADDPDSYYPYHLIWDDALDSYVQDPEFPHTTLTADEFFEDYEYVTEDVIDYEQVSCWYDIDQPATEEDNYQISYNQLTRDSDPDTVYIQLGTFENGTNNTSGYIIKSVYQDKSTGEYFLDEECTHGTERFEIDYKDFETSGFHFITETRNERVQVYYMSAYYEPDEDGSFEPQVIKASEPDAMYVAVPQGEDDGYLVYRLTQNPKSGAWIRSENVEWYDNADELAKAGYSFIIKNQPEQLIAAGSVYKGDMEVCVDGNGKSHLLLYGNIYDYSENNKIELGGKTYYLVTPNNELSVEDVTVPKHTVYYDVYDYTLAGTEFHYNTGAQPTFLRGDVNGDGKIDVTDATLVQLYAAEMLELTDEQLKAADANSDGKVDVTDATYIQLFVAELIDNL